jgi:hypothetical protein
MPKKGHGSGGSRFQARDTLTVLGDGGLHNSLDAFLGHSAVVADVFCSRITWAVYILYFQLDMEAIRSAI